MEKFRSEILARRDHKFIDPGEAPFEVQQDRAYREAVLREESGDGSSQRNAQNLETLKRIIEENNLVNPSLVQTQPREPETRPAPDFFARKLNI